MSLLPRGHPRWQGVPQRPEFVPEGWLAVFDAFTRLGKSLFRDDWTGSEWAARSTKQIAVARKEAKEAEERRREHVEKAKRASAGISTDLPPLVKAPRPTSASLTPPTKKFSDDKAEDAAHQRGKGAWGQLRQWLYSERVSAHALTERDPMLPIPKNVWARSNATFILYSGKAEFHASRGPGYALSTVEGWVLIRQDDLERAISEIGRPRPEEVEAPSPTIAAETACRNWLSRKVDEWKAKPLQERRRGPRFDDIWKEARERFPNRLTLRGFRGRVWDQVAPAEWKTAGRKLLRPKS